MRCKLWLDCRRERRPLFKQRSQPKCPEEARTHIEAKKTGSARKCSGAREALAGKKPIWPFSRSCRITQVPSGRRR